MLCSVPGLVEGEGFKRPTHYLALLLERATQLGQRHYLNTLLSVKKIPYIVQTCCMLASKGVVLNCINSEYELKHRALFITPELSSCEEHRECSSLPAPGRNEAEPRDHDLLGMG